MASKDKPIPPSITARPDIEGFAQVPEALEPLYHEHLNKAEIIVFQTLMRWQVGVNRYSRPVSDIARVTGMSLGSIRNALSGLVAKGFLKVESAGHRGHTAVYSIAIKGESVTDWLPKSRDEP